MMGLQIQYNPQNKKFKVKRVNVTTGTKDGDNTFYVRTPEETDKLPQGVLVAAHNATSGNPAITKFSSLNQAQHLGYEALTKMGSSAEAPAQEATAAEGTKPKRERKKKVEGEAEAPKGPRLTQQAPKNADQLKAARAGTKIAAMIDLLAAGVFADDLKTQLNRKGRALSGRIYRVHGYGIHSEVKDGRVFYTLVLPEGVNAPLAHVVPEEKPAKAPKAPKAEGEAAAGGEGQTTSPKRTRKPKGEAVAAGGAEGDGAAAVGA